MSSALAYPLRLPGWKLAVHLGLSIKTEVLVAFDKNAQKFAARCYDFDRKNPICAEGPDVPSLQIALDEQFHAALKKSVSQGAPDAAALAGDALSHAEVARCNDFAHRRSSDVAALLFGPSCYEKRRLTGISIEPEFFFCSNAFAVLPQCCTRIFAPLSNF